MTRPIIAAAQMLILPLNPKRSKRDQISSPSKRALPLVDVHASSRHLRLQMPILMHLRPTRVPINKQPLLIHHLLVIQAILLITPIILLLPLLQIPRRNPANQEEPEDVHRLQAREQEEGDDLRDPAFVLLRRPVQREAAHAGEFVGGEGEAREGVGEEGVEDAQVDEVAEVGPDEHEHDQEGAGDDVVEVVEDFGGLRVGISFDVDWFGKVGITARKKSEMSWVMYTATPMYVKWNL